MIDEDGGCDPGRALKKGDLVKLYPPGFVGPFTVAQRRAVWVVDRADIKVDLYRLDDPKVRLERVGREYLREDLGPLDLMAEID